MTEIITEKEATCPPEACDTFQFMAKEIGLSVLHPGGLRETRNLLKRYMIKPGSKILDLGCGKGSTSILLAETYGCHVVGVDIEDDLLEAARTKYYAKKAGRARIGESAQSGDGVLSLGRQEIGGRGLPQSQPQQGVFFNKQP